MTDKVNRDSEIVELMLGQFREWLEKNYGFDINYEELRRLAINLFWAEFMMIMKHAVDEQRQEDGTES